MSAHFCALRQEPGLKSLASELRRGQRQAIELPRAPLPTHAHGRDGQRAADAREEPVEGLRGNRLDEMRVEPRLARAAFVALLAPARDGDQVDSLAPRELANALGHFVAVGVRHADVE